MTKQEFMDRAVIAVAGRGYSARDAFLLADDLWAARQARIHSEIKKANWDEGESMDLNPKFKIPEWSLDLGDHSSITVRPQLDGNDQVVPGYRFYFDTSDLSIDATLGGDLNVETVEEAKAEATRLVKAYLKNLLTVLGDAP